MTEFCLKLAYRLRKVPDSGRLVINSQVILSEFPVGNNRHHRISGVGDIIVVPVCTYILVYGREEET